MTETRRVVMLDPDWFGDVEVERARFRRLLGEDVVVDAVDCPDEEIPEAIGPADVLLSHDTGVSADSMDATGCSVIARYATGVDGIDVDAATSRGIRVTRVPTYCNDEVATHAVSLALAFVRGLPVYDDAVADGRWEWSDAAPLQAVSDTTFGLLAFGNKGRATGEKATALGFDVCAYDPGVADAEIESAGVRAVGFETLLAEADVLSIHTPLTPETANLIDAAAIDRLDDDAVLVNTARGHVVDEDALLDALEADRLRGAGLDVLRSEPPEAENPLLGRDDVVVTPHAAWYSTRTADALRHRGTDIAVAAYEGEAVDGLVNPDALRR
ncbi:C-terminal binding protein [Salinigranum marinum]|uniref:C-terminal binding protein n=1 Tax=Salinigranum marinum TaxID=1515595 RepID=UPI002989E12C|nr:C-terminal binding protein [Salinigranum marinum]